MLEQVEERAMNRLARRIILFAAQGAYAGRSPFAPGTAGTLVGVVIYLLIKDAASWIYLITTALVAVAGTWAAGRAEKLLGKKDHPSIVIDEIAGYLIAMFMVPFGWGYVIAGFFLFRLFDILKPWPLCSLQNLRGGAGVMIDDIGAGMYTNFVLRIVSGVLNI